MKTKGKATPRKKATSSVKARVQSLTASFSNDPIKHVVVLMLENRSFDHLLGCMKSVYPMLEGNDRANPRVNFEGGRNYSQKPIATRQLPPKVDPFHEAPDAMDQMNTNKPCGGFVHNFLNHYPSDIQDAQEVMNYFDNKGATRLPVLHTLAENFLICDHWFSSVRGPTWANRFYVHSGTSLGRVFMPTGLFHNWHLYTQDTIYDRLNDAGVSWKIYHDGVPQSLVLTHQMEPQNAARYESIGDFFEDVKGAEADFPSYSFIEPAYFGSGQNDQHPPSNVNNGEALIANVYNAIRANAALWNSTLLVVLYDENGGFYDHVYPPAATPPDKLTDDGFTFDQYGFRVPALLISPWVPRNFSSRIFDHTSLLRYVSDKWSLSSLTKRVDAANSILPLLTTLSAPRTDTPAKIPAPALPKAAVAAVRTAFVTPTTELNDLQKSLITLTELLEQKTDDSAKAKTARAAQLMVSQRDQIAVAHYRLDRFLEQQRRRANIPTSK